MTPPSSRRLWWGVACAVAVLCLWTSFILVTRFSTRHTLAPFDIVFLRFAFSGLAVLPLLAWRRHRGRPLLGRLSPAQAAALAGTAGIGYCAFAYSGFFYAPAAHAAVLLPGSLPMWTALIAAWLLRERLTPRRLLGLALIVAGDALVGGASLLQAAQGGQTWRGDLLFLGGSCTWGFYTVLCRRWSVDAVDATCAIALGCLLTAVPVYAAGAALGAWPSRLAEAPWREIAFQAVYQGGFAMLIAGMAYTQVVRTIGPVRTVMVTALVPVLAALAAVPLLGEPLGVLPLAGLGCVTLGLLFGLRAPAGAAHSTPPRAAASTPAATPSA